MRTFTRLCGTMALAALTLVACDRDPVTAPQAAPEEAVETRATPGLAQAEYSFAGEGAVFDIAALPNGNLLVAVTGLLPPEADEDFSGNTIHEIGREGPRELTEIPVAEGSPINGLEPLGQRSYFATSGGQDLAEGAGLWRVSQGNARLVADIEAFTMGSWVIGDPEDRGRFHDNDLADAGPYPDNWKDFRCETFAEFGHGPQTNPYHLTALSGSQVLIGDAANNGVLRANTNGQVGVVAFMEPPIDPAPENDGWMVLGYVDEDGEIVGIGKEADGPVECYVEPVPTSVAIGPDGAWYVGELTGTTPGNFAGAPSPAISRVWRIQPGAHDVTCPSSACEEVISGLASVIDIEFGPDGLLYVLEYERNGFLATVAPALGIPLAGGSLMTCDVIDASNGMDREECDVLPGAGNLTLPGAITFDTSDNLWLVENVFEPTIRITEWDG